MGKASRRKRMFRTGVPVYTGPVIQEMSRRDAVVGVLVLLLLLGWVGYLLFGEASKVWAVTTSAGWPVVQGEVLGGRVEVEQTGQGRWERNVFRPAVSYRYRVNGRDYTGDIYRLHPRTENERTEAGRLVASLVPGSRVQVFYNPDAPGEAYLAASFLTGRDYLALAASAVMFFVLLAITVLVLLPEPKPLRLRKPGRSVA